MEMESGKKVQNRMSSSSSSAEAFNEHTKPPRLLPLVLVVLRIGAMLSTGTAALVMGFNKEIKILTLGMIGTASINQTHVADFKQTPSLIYFVIANSITSVYNLSALILSLFPKRRRFSALLHLTDSVVLALIATAVSVAATIGNLEKKGNFYNRWFPICASGAFVYCDSFSRSVILRPLEDQHVEYQWRSKREGTGQVSIVQSATIFQENGAQKTCAGGQHLDSRFASRV